MAGRENRPLASGPVVIADESVGRESAAGAAFEARWTRRALRSVDPQLADRLDEQRELFGQALLAGLDDDIVLHGEAMVRGWHEAIARMDAEPDDAYLLGEDPVSGVRVAISQQRSSEARVREFRGNAVIFLTPDEVATIFAGTEAVRTVKQLWPGAEIIHAKTKADTAT